MGSGSAFTVQEIDRGYLMDFGKILLQGKKDFAAFKEKSEKNTVPSTAWSKGGHVVSDILRTALESGKLHQSEPQRSTGLHPSELFYMCMRAKGLGENFPRVMSRIPGVVIKECTETISASLRAKFDIGHSLHWLYQNKYLGPLGILKGSWRCRSCQEEIEGFYPTANVCSCGKNKWSFVEPKIEIPELCITGHCDGIIDRGDGPWVMDIKTIDPTLFKSLKEPSMSYVYQVHAYMMGLGINRALILYVDKSSNTVNPTKEILISYDESVEQRIRALSADYQEMNKTRALPPKTCDSNTCAAAKRCPYKDICFGEDVLDMFKDEWKQEGLELKKGNKNG